MASRPRLLKKPKLTAAQRTSSASPTISTTPTPPPPAQAPYVQHLSCVICGSQANIRKLDGAPLKIFRDKALVVDQIKGSKGVKIVCEPCNTSLKQISTYQNKISSFGRKMAEIVEELKDKAKWAEDVAPIEDEGEVEAGGQKEGQSVEQFSDNGAETIVTNGQQPTDNQGQGQGLTTDVKMEDVSQGDNQQQNLTGLSSDVIVEDVFMEIEPLSHLGNDVESLIIVSYPNQVKVEEDVVIKCEFEPEDVEVMPLQSQNTVESSSPQAPIAPSRQLPNSTTPSSSSSKGYFPVYANGHLSKLFVTKNTDINKTLVDLGSPPRTGGHSRVFCPECKLFFENQSSFSRHLNYSPRHGSEASIKACCPCAMTFPSLFHRMEHDRAKHPEMYQKRSKPTVSGEIPPTIKCGTCAAEFYSEDGYKKHLHLGVDAGCEGGVACGRCPQVFGTLDEADAHAQQCNGVAGPQPKMRKSKRAKLMESLNY